MVDSSSDMSGMDSNVMPHISNSKEVGRSVEQFIQKVLVEGRSAEKSYDDKA